MPDDMNDKPIEDPLDNPLESSQASEDKGAEIPSPDDAVSAEIEALVDHLDLDEDDTSAYADTEPDRPSQLNLSIEDETLAVQVTIDSSDEEAEDEEAKDEEAVPKATTLEFSAEADHDVNQSDDSGVADEINITFEAETEPVSVLSEEDLALIDEVPVPEDTSDVDTGDTEPDTVAVDIIDLDEDDNQDILATPAAPRTAPPEPEWKRVARELREDREKQRREMIEQRRKEDKRVATERKARQQELENLKEQQEAEFREDWEQRQQEKRQAVEDMMQRIREERERKQQERAETDKKEFGRQFTYPKPPERKPYPKPSELRRMEREQPKTDLPTDEVTAPSPPPQKDFESRVNRLAKPDAEAPDETSSTDDETPAPSDDE